MTQLNALPTHLVALAMEEFPQPVGALRALECENRHPGRHRNTRFICSKIAEDISEEETLDEDRAHRSFQQSLESLRRCTQKRLLYQVSSSISTHSSVDSSDPETA
ncbi:hypothetical protein Baya_1566 [Bagarius yarrelli]|uniref:Uncharacterized protein n=1 Tax=Bagarius yarrelli TaxID=175774 RepID=A0A556TLH0_BAGYA|nr:hypothetical protein Baya_1566 [Bagarius yarrelli]